MSEERTPVELLAECVVKYGEGRMRFVLERELTGRSTDDEREKAQFRVNDDTNIDMDAYVSHGDEGFWVSAWVWVRKPECPECYTTLDDESKCCSEDCERFGQIVDAD